MLSSSVATLWIHMSCTIILSSKEKKTKNLKAQKQDKCRSTSTQQTQVTMQRGKVGGNWRGGERTTATLATACPCWSGGHRWPPSGSFWSLCHPGPCQSASVSGSPLWDPRGWWGDHRASAVPQAAHVTNSGHYCHVNYNPFFSQSNCGLIPWIMCRLFGLS